MISFNVPICVGNELRYLEEAIKNRKICGDGPFCRKCGEWLEDKLHAYKVMLTTSGSSALDMSALLYLFPISVRIYPRNPRNHHEA